MGSAGLVITGGPGFPPISDAQAASLPGPANDPKSGYKRYIIERLFPGGPTEIATWLASRIQSTPLYRTDTVLVKAVPWDAMGPNYFEVIYDEGVFAGTASVAQTGINQPAPIERPTPPIGTGGGGAGGAQPVLSGAQVGKLSQLVAQYRATHGGMVPMGEDLITILEQVLG